MIKFILPTLPPFLCFLDMTKNILSSLANIDPIIFEHEKHDIDEVINYLLEKSLRICFYTNLNYDLIISRLPDLCKKIVENNDHSIAIFYLDNFEGEIKKAYIEKCLIAISEYKMHERITLSEIFLNSKDAIHIIICSYFYNIINNQKNDLIKRAIATIPDKIMDIMNDISSGNLPPIKSMNNLPPNIKRELMAMIAPPEMSKFFASHFFIFRKK